METQDEISYEEFETEFYKELIKRLIVINIDGDEYRFDDYIKTENEIIFIVNTKSNANSTKAKA